MPDLNEIIVKKVQRSERYGFLSGFFKARESLFLCLSDLNSLAQAFEMEDLMNLLSGKRYAGAIHRQADPRDFENALWEVYFEELKVARQYLDDPYLTTYLTYFHSIIFSQEEIAYDEIAQKQFDQRLSYWVALSSKGTPFTRELSAYAVDRFNITELFRSRIHQKDEYPFYPHGNLPKSSLEALFDSRFQHLSKEILFSRWHAFFDNEKAYKSLSFELILRFEYFWLDLIDSLLESPMREPYGINYILAYFLTFMLEIESIKRHYLRLKFGLPSYWMKEGSGR